MFEEKFENVNVLETLNRILLKNTIHNREDFEYDKEFIIDMSKSENTNDKMLLWMCRPHGTFCHTEQEIFQDGTFANYTWRHFGEENSKGILAFAIEIKGEKGGIITGDIYPMDFLKHEKLVKQQSVPVGKVEAVFEDAVRTFTYEEYRKSTLSIIGKYGDVIELRSFSSKPECLEALLQKFRSERRGAKKCSADRYIDALIVRKA